MCSLFGLRLVVVVVVADDVLGWLQSELVTFVGAACATTTVVVASSVE